MLTYSAPPNIGDHQYCCSTPAFAELQTMSGDIRVCAANPGAVTAGSMSGDVTVTASPDAPASGPDVRATSKTGRVSIPR
ncbi:hypothetical protein [Kitasatospora sp. NPDC001527]|uniref:hypothetical protein n=1 Tax=Kitasatospora sp. NPDC001527 TaxID=3154519 RepID=UPI0033244D31